MAEKIGRFEIASQLAQSAFATVYKAVDTESQQTVALKVVRLDGVKDRAAFMQAILDEAEQVKPLNSPNIAGLYGVGDEGDLLLAAMEYIQGNSIATTLARHEGFSIWDLEDIARQVCHALDHAHAHNAVHYSLEPEKIMVQWDGIVKVLSFGTSAMNSQAMASSDAVPGLLHYVAPEQLRGEKCDHRSALFSLGAVLYEMATDQKAFPGETTDQVRTAILESTPPLPHRLKANINPALSALIMKAIAKPGDERYQSGHELVRDLEQCKASVRPPVPSPAVMPKKEAVKTSAAAAGASAATASAPKSAAKASFAVDPMMAESDTAAAPVQAQRSFSDIEELPPLQEVYVASPPAAPAVEEEPEVEEDVPAPVPAPAPKPTIRTVAVKKPTPARTIQVREAAQKAVREIRKTPPQLYMYAVGGAAALILLVVVAMALYSHFEDSDSEGSTTAVRQQPATQPQAAPAAQSAPIEPPLPPQAEAPQAEAPEAVAPQQPEQSTEQPEQETEQPLRRREARHARTRHTATRAVAAVAPGQLSILSTPAGAQVSFDGSALCETPCTLTGIAPGQHMVTASKAGYVSTSRNIAMLAGANSSLSLDLSPLSTSISVASTPSGAVILLDGKQTGKFTPALLNVGRPGTYTITLERPGYLDQSSSVNVESGRSASVNLALTHLGNTDDIRAAGGKFKKVFGHGGESSGMAIVSIKTQPKGAQIMVNNRVLDKTTPFDFYLDPGTYVIDITMSGYQGLHKVISVQEGEKQAIQETLSPE
jgi:serine/threonine protein kinase